MISGIVTSSEVPDVSSCSDVRLRLAEGLEFTMAVGPVSWNFRCEMVVLLFDYCKTSSCETGAFSDDK